MAILMEYKKIQDKFAKELTPLQCSESFSSFRRADSKVLKALKDMDGIAGKNSARMLGAAKDFAETSTPYFNKLEGQLRKEKKNQKLIKKELTKFQFNIYRIVEDYRSDAQKLAETEAKAGDQGETRGKGKSVADDAAAKVNERKLAQAIAAFNDRRDKHLKASQTVLTATQNAARAVTNLRKSAAQQLANAEDAAGKGNPEGASRMIPAIEKMASDSVKLADAALAKHSRDLKDKFQKERNMSFKTLEKEFDLAASSKPAFERNQKSKARVFTQATDNGKQALDLISQMRVNASEVEAMAQQAAAAVEGGEKLRAFVLRDLTSGGSSSGGLIAKAIEEYDSAVESLDKRMESTIGAVKTFRSNTDPSKSDGMREAAVSFGNVLFDASNTADRKWDRLETTFKNVQRKVPKIFSDDREILGALQGYIKEMARVKKTHSNSKKNVKALEKLLGTL